MTHILILCAQGQFARVATCLFLKHMVWFPPGEKHWHGAAPTTAMTHIAIAELLNGKAVDWMEKVTDEQYGA